MTGTTGHSQPGQEQTTVTATPNTTRRTRPGRSSEPTDAALDALQAAAQPGPGNDTTPGPETPASGHHGRAAGGCADCVKRQQATAGAVAGLAAELDAVTRRQWAMIGAAFGVGLAAAGLAILAILATRRAASSGGSSDE